MLSTWCKLITRTTKTFRRHEEGEVELIIRRRNDWLTRFVSNPIRFRSTRKNESFKNCAVIWMRELWLARLWPWSFGFCRPARNWHNICRQAAKAPFKCGKRLIFDDLSFDSRLSKPLETRWKDFFGWVWFRMIFLTIPLPEQTRKVGHHEKENHKCVCRQTKSTAERKQKIIQSCEHGHTHT